jgi:hypothetical protein
VALETPGQRDALIGVGRRVVNRRVFGKEPALSSSVTPFSFDAIFRTGRVGAVAVIRVRAALRDDKVSFGLARGYSFL